MQNNNASGTFGLILISVALFIGGGAAFIYGVSDVSLSLFTCDNSQCQPSARMVYVGLACWAGSALGVALAASRFLSSRNKGD